MAQFRQELDKTVKAGDAKASLKPNGQKKDIAGRACDGYDISVAMPMALGGDAEMTMVMTGPVFIAKGAPGSADYAKFHLAAAEKGFIMSDPRAAKGAPSQAKGMTELYKAMADTGGIPYYMEMNMKIEGGGPDGRHDEQGDGRIGVHAHRHGGFHRRRRRPTSSTSRPTTRSRTRSSRSCLSPISSLAHDSVIAAELRPPRAELAASEGMDAWIDTYHAVRGLTRRGVPVFLTDSAVGLQEEDNLRHLIANLGTSVPRELVVPFLTSKHTLEYCLSYAERAWHNDFKSLVVLGGDKHVGPPRSVEHAWQLRRAIRAREPHLALGGWANPNADADRQVGYLTDGTFDAEFFLTQIVSHHTDRARGAISRGRRAGGADAAGHVRRVLLPQREPEDAAHAEPVPAGAGRGADARLRRRRDAGRGLRAHDQGAEAAGRTALLRQQPAALEGRRDA